jgi:hypothetical protein
MPKVKPLTESGRKALRKQEVLESVSRDIKIQGIMAGCPHGKAIAARIGMPYSTFQLRVHEPGSMRLSEFYDILQLPGVDKAHLLQALLL